MLFPSTLASTTDNLIKLTVKLVVFAFIATTLIACTAANTIPKADARLIGTKAGNFDYVLTLPGAGIAPFNKIFIEEPQVAFNKRWLVDFRTDYTDRDLQRITNTYGAMLKKTLTKGVLTQTGATVVSSAAEADVIFRPQLRELYLYGPDLNMPGRARQYIYEAGNATFDLTLLEADNNSVIAQFIDHRETSANIGDHLEPANRATNARYFRLLMERWSKNLTDYLTAVGSVPAN